MQGLKVFEVSLYFGVSPVISEKFHTDSVEEHFSRLNILDIRPNSSENKKLLNDST